MEIIDLPKADRVLVAGHRNYDADSISCCAAVSNYYRKNGIDARFFYCGEANDGFDFILKGMVIELSPDRFAPDLIVISDTCIDQNYRYRLGIDLDRHIKRGCWVLAIDHHPNENPLAVNLQTADVKSLSQRLQHSEFTFMYDSDCVSTGSVYIRYFGFTDPILYNAIKADSGNFSRRTLSALEDLKRLDIDDETIQRFNELSRPKPRDKKVH